MPQPERLDVLHRLDVARLGQRGMSEHRLYADQE
jgi:hypothetical protein